MTTDEAVSPVLKELAPPPKPPLAFRVGVVGHRPNRLKHANLEVLESRIREVLVAVRDEVAGVFRSGAEWYAPGEPKLCAITPLAEGTDRIFGEVALDLGWELCCVMPFPQADYEKDFEEGQALEKGSLGRFRSLLNRAAEGARLTTIQLDGTREHPDSNPYGEGGKMVLDLSDLLIVVWDDDRSADKKGGTSETLNAARIAGIPLVVIDARMPHEWPLAGTGSLGSLAQVHEAVAGILRVPESVPKKRTGHDRSIPFRDGLKGFYQERRPGFSFALAWRIFRDVIGDGRCIPAASPRIEPFEAAVLDDWPHYPGNMKGTDTPCPVQGRIADRLRPFYAWPDKLAELYANRYRSSYLTCYLLAATAVGMALLPVGFRNPGMEDLWTALELTCILLILLFFVAARSRSWHEKWLDYRLAAELIRHLRLVAPLCGRPPFPHVPAHHLAHGQPEGTWMNWYLRAVTRSLSPGDMAFGNGCLRQHLEALKSILDRQVKFHENNQHRSETIERRLHFGIIASLVLTLMACFFHLMHALFPGHLLTFFCGFLPAVGATLAAINNQGEFRRMAKRSSAMRVGIRKLLDRTKALLEKTGDSVPTAIHLAAAGPLMPEVRQLSLDSADLLLREVLDWRVLFIDRPPEVGP